MRFNQIEIVTGDITQQRVDAIVNAANTSVLGGGGVDGAIHRAAGPELLEECRKIGGCPTGEARITKGYRLPAQWVVYTVGPVWRGGGHNEEELLSRCYRNSLTLASRPVYGIRIIAFPSISTGVYGYPIEQAALVAIDEVDRFLAEHNHFARVTFVCFSQSAYDVYVDTARGMLE